MGAFYHAEKVLYSVPHDHYDPFSRSPQRYRIVSLRLHYFVPEVNSVNSPDISDCQAGCSQCSSDSSIPAARGEEIFTGWRLGVAALWVFVLPLVLAITAAIVARWYWPGPTRMLLAALTGLAAGGAISWAASRAIRTTHTEIEDDSNEI